MTSKNSKLIILGAFISGLFLTGCSTTGETNNNIATSSIPINDDYYEVHHDGRIHIFDDSKTYLSYLEVGETAYRKVYIGEGPQGKTLVFGLTKEDKNKSSGIASIDMYHGKLAGAEDFYGEMKVEGRIYVFSTWKDLLSFKKVGEATYRFTQIGAGPNGNTVVYVLNKSNKKKQPDVLISKFKKMHNLK